MLGHFVHLNFRNAYKILSAEATEGNDCIHTIQELRAQEGGKRLFGLILAHHSGIGRKAADGGGCFVTMILLLLNSFGSEACS